MIAFRVNLEEQNLSIPPFACISPDDLSGRVKANCELLMESLGFDSSQLHRTLKLCTSIIFRDTRVNTPAYANSQEIAFYDNFPFTDPDHLDNLLRLKSVGNNQEIFRMNNAFLIDSIYESNAQLKVFQALYSGEIPKTLLQVGGHGSHALRHLILGGKSATLLTPSLGEALFASIASRFLGIVDEFQILLGYAEDLPFTNCSFDIVYFGGSLHHTKVLDALKESQRVLNNSGAIYAIEAVKVPLYSAGIRFFGKRESEVFCNILSQRDLDDIVKAYPESTILRGGVYIRYLLIVFKKLGLYLPRKFIYKIQLFFDCLFPNYFKKQFGSWAFIQIPKAQ